MGVVSGVETSLLVVGQTAYTNYSCSVDSSTAAGRGPVANVVGTTKEASECVCVCERER